MLKEMGGGRYGFPDFQWFLYLPPVWKFLEAKFGLNLGSGNLCFAPRIPVVFILVVSVISANPAISALVCGCLSCLRRFHDSRRFREKHCIAKHRFGKT